MAKQIWGWTSYNATGWVNETPDGTVAYKQYVGRFMTDGLHEYTTARILFWAKRPIIALRSIVAELNQGANPLNFENETID